MKKNYTEEEIKEIFDEYLRTDCTITYIYEKYGWTLKKLFKDYNLTIRKSRLNRYPLKWCADKIINEIEAYIIGFWFADGYVSKQQAGIKLKNAESEFNLLTTIKNYIMPEQTLKYERNKAAVKLIISSNEFIDNLKNLGVLEHKTYQELKIPKMDDSLLRHFIRGYFDADGTVFYDRQYLKSNFCSINENFLIQIQDILTKYGIESKINVEIRQGKSLLLPDGSFTENCKNMYRLFVRKKEALELFKKFLYENSTIYLQRKKDVFYRENTEEK